MRIGIFGGSFNPPHRNHLLLSTELIKNNLVDRVIFVPTGNFYHKPELIAVELRYNMLKLMCEDNPALDVSDYEIKTELTYTYQTIDYFKKEYPLDTIYFIMGSDNLEQFSSWRNYEYMLENDNFIILSRDGYLSEELVGRYNDNNFIYFNFDKEEISSTIIRNGLKNNDVQSLEKYLNKKVLKYILQNNLYK